MTAQHHLDHTPVFFQKTAFIGLGLIGASLAQSMLDKHLTKEIVACDNNLDTLNIAKEVGLIEHGSNNLTDILPDCDLVIICVPVQAVLPIFETLAKAKLAGILSADCIISDVCSTKVNVVNACQMVEQKFGVNLNFIPAHPIAGAEHSGVLSRQSDLFVNHELIICKNHADDKYLRAIKALWQGVGARVSLMTADKHDTILSLTSHLPHLLSYALTYQLAKDDENLNIFRYAAGGFRDFSRISASSPIMWHDIFLANKEAVLKGLDNYQAILDELKSAIENDNSDELLNTFETAKNARDYFGRLLVEKEKLNNSNN
ncbi:prephenate dehydrogenase/arogenate dehydrogenase family protein [Moraxella sp. ZY200743]|uniref:prephenate dehydrogenase/arogenate dehydrogenase family protein n=1 Tax=Moraxella sp. ZY200743 TaxID=2911970 RepID=UPI003D7CE6ED